MREFLHKFLTHLCENLCVNVRDFYTKIRLKMWEKSCARMRENVREIFTKSRYKYVRDCERILQWKTYTCESPYRTKIHMKTHRFFDSFPLQNSVKMIIRNYFSTISLPIQKDLCNILWPNHVTYFGHNFPNKSHKKSPDHKVEG